LSVCGGLRRVWGVLQAIDMIVSIKVHVLTIKRV
jgi:hypothetical protein